MTQAALVETPRELQALLLRQIREAEELEEARKHPGLLLRHVFCVDNTNGDRFRFVFSDEQIERWKLNPFKIGKPYHAGFGSVEQAKAELYGRLHDHGSDNWYWHGDLLDWWLVNDVTINLKGRQLGVTWCDGGLNMWLGTYWAGTRTIIQSKNEDDAADYVDHVWEMWSSLGPREDPDTGVKEDFTHLRNGARVIVPGREGVRPHLDIEWEHKIRNDKGEITDTKVSMMNAMASTAAAGHGRTATRVSLDEFSRHPYAREAWKATIPTQGGSKRVTGKANVISTGNGVSNDQDDSGNYFHLLYTRKDELNIAGLFLRWDMNADRDEEWYRSGPPSRMLAKDRGEQYPRNEREAFILTGDVYYDAEVLEWYSQYRVRAPLEFFGFKQLDDDPSAARRVVLDFRTQDTAPIALYQRPRAGVRYGLAADVSGGKGLDAHSAHVIDLSNREICAHLHSARLSTRAYARQLHYLGAWFNFAWLAVEDAGGWGEPVITDLRDGRDGRKPYPKLYRHHYESDVDRKQKADYGYPMNTATRPQAISLLGQGLEEKTIPYLDHMTMNELFTFVHKKSHPSPAAQEGSRDDCVMSLAVALDLYRQRGYHAKRAHSRRKTKRSSKMPRYPFEKERRDVPTGHDGPGGGTDWASAGRRDT